MPPFPDHSEIEHAVKKSEETIDRLSVSEAEREKMRDDLRKWERTLKLTSDVLNLNEQYSRASLTEVKEIVAMRLARLDREIDELMTPEQKEQVAKEIGLSDDRILEEIARTLRGE